MTPLPNLAELDRRPANSIATGWSWGIAGHAIRPYGRLRSIQIGYQMGLMDGGHIPETPEYLALVAEFIARERKNNGR